MQLEANKNVSVRVFFKLIF